MRLGRRLSLICALVSTLWMPTVVAKDASVEARLDARGLKYEIDEDGDYRLSFSYEKEARSQLAFISGNVQTVGGFQVREIFSPAGRAERDGINGAKALELMAESRQNKLGSWELHGDVLFFVIKLPDSLDAAQLASALSIAAQTADDMEIELSGDKDEL